MNYSYSKRRQQTPLSSPFRTRGVLERWKYSITGLVTLAAVAIMTSAVAVSIIKFRPTDGVGQNANGTNFSNEENTFGQLNYVLNEIESNIDPTVDPCDDFYEFACGSFPKRYPIPGGQTEVNYHTLHFEKMYRTLVDRLKGDKFESKDTIKPLKYLKRIWDSCLRDSSEIFNQMDKMNEYFKQLDQLNSWQEKFFKLTKDGFNVLFTVKLSGANLEKAKVVIGPPQLVVEKAKTYSVDSTVTLNYYQDLVMFLKKDQKLASDVMQFDHMLVTKTILARGRRPQNSLMTVEQLSQYTQIDWNLHLNQLFTNFKVTNSTQVLVEDVWFIEKFDDGVSRASDEFFDEYFKIEVLHQSCFFMGSPCRNSQFNFISQIDSSFKNESDEFAAKTCFNFLTKNFEELMFKAWDLKDENRDTFMEDRIRQSVLDVGTELTLLVRNFSWMEDITKSRARTKMAMVQGSSSRKAPGYIFDDDELEMKYADAPFINATDKIELFDYFTNISAYAKSLEYSKTKEIDDFSWPISLFSTLPFLAHESTNIFVPDFFIQGPFAFPELPDPIHYGFFVSMLAHEMTHTFDAEANYYEETRGSKIFWTKRTKNNFDEKMECLVELYDEQEVEVWYYMDEKIMNVNGTASLNENLADLIGLNVAFELFSQKNKSGLDTSGFPGQLKNVTDDQLFFLSYANVHCSNQVKPMLRGKLTTLEPLPKFIVNLPLAQTKNFARTFNCKPGSKMNPFEKCSSK